jgi:hypothetical protein
VFGDEYRGEGSGECHVLFEIVTLLLCGCVGLRAQDPSLVTNMLISIQWTQLFDFANASVAADAAIGTTAISAIRPSKVRSASAA